MVSARFWKGFGVMEWFGKSEFSGSRSIKINLAVREFMLLEHDRSKLKKNVGRETAVVFLSATFMSCTSQ